MPPCPTGILQNPTGPCPASAGDDAGIVPETLRYRKAPGGGRNRPPYKAAAGGQQRTNASHPPGPPAGRCKHRPLRRGAAGCRLPVPLPRVRHMAGRAISPAANPSAAANLSGGRERPPYKTGQTGIRTGNGGPPPWANTGQAPAKMPPALPVLRRRALLRYPKSAYLSKVSVSNIVALPGKCKPRRQAVRRGKFCCPYRCPAGRIRVQ